jgi:hypothetical protein
MGVIVSLIPLLIQFAPTIEAGALHFWNWISSVRTAAQQADVWTPAAEAAFQAYLLTRAAAPAWQPDPVTTAP